MSFTSPAALRKTTSHERPTNARFYICTHHSTPTTMRGRRGGREVYKKGICVHMVSITRSHVRFRINRLYCTISCPTQSGGAIIVFRLFSSRFVSSIFVFFFFCLHGNGWMGRRSHRAVFCLSLLLLRGFFGWIVFSCLCVVAGGCGGVGWDDGGGLKDGGEEW